MIPTYMLCRMGTNNVEIHGVRYKVSVVPESMCDTTVSELTQQILMTGLVGIDVKTDPWSHGLVLLVVETRCLIFQLSNYPQRFPTSLRKLSTDETICFVGIELNSKLSDLKRASHFRKECNNWVELGEFVVRSVQKPELLSAEKASILAGEVGLRAETFSPIQLSSPVPKWNAEVFSKEEIKYIIQDASASYLIAKKALSLLPDDDVQDDVTVKQESE